jgi:hypothetical protein
MRALHICEKWAADNDMQWSIPKCAIVGECEPDLFLDGKKIPKAPEYKYLGAIHRAKGVDWKQTYTRATAKQSRLLTTLLDKNWHPKVRLIIFRTFLRPINEYTAALTWLWAKKSPESRSDLLKLMKQSHENAIKWIFNRRRHRRLLDYMSGLGPWDYRMNCLHAGLFFSLSKMHPLNPLIAARSLYMVSTSRDYLLIDAFKSDYASKFLAETRERTNACREKITWPTWRRQQMNRLQSEAARQPYGATLAYYSPARNSDHSAPIFNLESSSFDIILNWRSNNMLLYRTCSCSATFNRSHQTCILGSHMHFNAIIDDHNFKRSFRTINAASTSNYRLTVMDHLLNTSQHQTFLDLYNQLENALTPSSRVSLATSQNNQL